MQREGAGRFAGYDGAGRGEGDDAEEEVDGHGLGFDAVEVGG